MVRVVGRSLGGIFALQTGRLLSLSIVVVLVADVTVVVDSLSNLVLQMPYRDLLIERVTPTLMYLPYTLQPWSTQHF